MERWEAISAGLTRYYTGKPCFKGHLSERNTKSGQCLECVRKGPRKARWGRAGDPEKAKLRAYEWRERNPDKLKYIQWANAANMRKAPGSISYADLMAMELEQRVCRYCRSEIEELDHILPVKLGGTNWPWNLQFLCHDCNRLKAQRHPLEFETDEGFYGDPWILLFTSKPKRKSSFMCEKV